MSELLYISMLGESDVYRTDHFKPLCPSGLEKDWIRLWHSPLAASYGFTLLARDICRGETLPEPGYPAAVILGGTAHLILEDRAWIAELRKWLEAYRKLHKPLLGICGGHQLMAVTFLQWPLRKLEKTKAGTFKVRLTKEGRSHPLFQGLPAAPEFHFANDYHVLPASASKATILATSVDSPALAIDYGCNWFSTQFHPESRRETWECFFGHDPNKDLGLYKSEDNGPHLLENFLQIAGS